MLEVLKEATARGGMTTSNVSTTDQYSINVVHRDKPAGAIAHAGNTELHYIIEGSATVVTGGKLVRGATAAAGTIDGGVTRHMSKGDVVIAKHGELTSERVDIQDPCSEGPSQPTDMPFAMKRMTYGGFRVIVSS